MNSNFKKPTTQKGWDQQNVKYSQVWEKPFRRWLSTQELDFIEKSLKSYIKDNNIKKSEVKILDIGSGTGRILDLYLKKDYKGSVYSVDYAKGMTENLKKKYGNNKIIVKQLDISKESPKFNVKFDFISSIRVLKYSKKWKKSVKNVSKVMKKNGYFVFTMPNSNSLTVLSNDDWSKTTISEIKKVLSENDLDLVEADGFIRIPDFLYNIDFLYHLNVFIERTLHNLFKGHLLSREVFILAKKK